MTPKSASSAVIQPQMDDKWAQHCAAYAEYTHTPWDWLVDLTPIKQEQRLLRQWNFTDAWLLDHLKIGANDTFALCDTKRTDYSFQEFTAFKTTLGRKYQHPQHLSTLAHRPERLQLGTLFSSSRLHRDRGNAIRDELGGMYFDDLDDLDNRAPPYIPPDIPSLRVPHPYLHCPILRALLSSPAQFTCMHQWPAGRSRLPLLHTSLFLATDAVIPWNSTLLVHSTRTFPSTFFLEDFSVQTGALNSPRCARDGVALREFMLSFLEAMVAGRTLDVIGTEGCTFSSFVKTCCGERMMGERSC
ncbi:hypothetical protein SCP_1900530 [Sparassis crispa]|uniref:Uncharacterized protein n=1 Tax=Sparassis crispa TaxID=139825 RepID=A0A401H706_9APHY|nr:hypothetical protein SCP_1900530 [Sparassis crispa]GBE90204.1 hypothetical protein SCP_1900530 [Sparassis crispa]